MAFLKGLDTVLRNLNKEIKAIEGRSVKGMGLAVMAIHNDTETVHPLVPVGETGNLHNSWFNEPLMLASGPAVIFGYSANYAAYVHEMLGAHFQRPGAGPKWFQSHIRRTKERTLRIIWENARID